MQRLSYVFDLDGTLADTRTIVEQAYKCVGVDMPEDAWGKPAELWLPDVVVGDWQEVQRLKNVAYRAIIDRNGVQPLAAAYVAKALIRTHPTYVLTGASPEATLDVLEALKMVHVPVLATRCSLARKFDELNALGRGIYFDDDKAACLGVSRRTEFKAVHVAATDHIDSLMWKMAHG